MASLYVGFYLGYKEGVAQTSRILSEQAQKNHNNAPQDVQRTNSIPVHPGLLAAQKNEQIFPKNTKSFVTGMSLVDRDDFADKFDTGGT